MIGQLWIQVTAGLHKTDTVAAYAVTIELLAHSLQISEGFGVLALTPDLLLLGMTELALLLAQIGRIAAFERLALCNPLQIVLA